MEMRTVIVRVRTELQNKQGRSVAWARPGYSHPDFVGVSLHFCVLDLALRIRTAWEPV